MTDTYHDRIYVDGAWTVPDGKGAIEVVNSSTEEVMGHVPECDATDADRAVAAARSAFDAWSGTDAAERSGLLRAISEGIMSRAEEIGELIAREVGMPLKLSIPIQAMNPAQTFVRQAEILDSFTWTEEAGRAEVVFEPVGVVGAITPWNYPLHQISLKVAPALAAGCTVVLKPSEVAPLNAFVFAEIADAAGVPPGVFNLVSGFGPVVGEAIARSPEVDMVSFTGSTRAGRRVSELASATVKRVQLELGGKSANVILDDADLEAAVTGGVRNAFLNSGQTCSAHTRMLVPRDRLAEVEALAAQAAEALTPGDPLGAGKLGPLVSARQLARVREYIRAGVEEGARLVTGGDDLPDGLTRGYYVRPTVFSDVKPHARIAQEEIFGPVLAIIPYDTEDEAIDIANDTIYGLSGGVWSADPDRARRVALALRTGEVAINGGGSEPLAPFGGYKQSGLGREAGVYGFEEYLETKALLRRD
ncbi:MAG: aldehyde dehydrogenase family protein [Acidimicrobiia bacterium]|nr:aldehyde dehydrogenase family protein [Acidimicrobiia bacterium]